MEQTIHFTFLRTKLPSTEMENANIKLCFANFSVVYATGRKDGLTMLWKPNASLELLSY